MPDGTVAVVLDVSGVVTVADLQRFTAAAVAALSAPYPAVIPMESMVIHRSDNEWTASR